MLYWRAPPLTSPGKNAAFYTFCTIFMHVIKSRSIAPRDSNTVSGEANAVARIPYVTTRRRSQANTAKLFLTRSTRKIDATFPGRLERAKMKEQR